MRRLAYKVCTAKRMTYCWKLWFIGCEWIGIYSTHVRIGFGKVLEIDTEGERGKGGVKYAVNGVVRTGKV